MRIQAWQRGVSLIEVMIAVLVFSVGLLGLSGLLVTAARSSDAAYLRTQVTFLAGGMVERMRANPAAVWNGDYDGEATAGGDASACTTAACTPAELARRDRAAWATQLAIVAPDATGDIRCDRRTTDLAPSPQLNGVRPPFGGSCAMTVRWTERQIGDEDHRGAGTQTFAWVFQP
jgi:type IV pilus assembly protein PilV